MGGQQVMCFMELAGFGGGCFWESRKLFLKNRKVLREKCKTSNLLHTKTFWINLKVFIRSHHFCVMPSHDFSLSFLLNPPPLPISAAIKITCNFTFHRPLAASSPHCNFDFPQTPILRLYHSSPFAPVQSLKAVSGTSRFNFYKKHACVELWTEVAGR